MKFYLLSDNIDTKTGLRLAGIDGCIAYDKEDFINAFEKTIKDKDIAVILITEKLFKLNKGYIENYKMKNLLPIILELPDRHSAQKDENYIKGYVKDAVGINI